MENLKSRFTSDEGAIGIAELVFMIGFVVVLVVLIMGKFSASINEQSDSTNACLTNPNSAACKAHIDKTNPGK